MYIIYIHTLQKITDNHDGNVTPLDSAGQHLTLLAGHSLFHYFLCTRCLIFITVWFCIFYSQETGGVLDIIPMVANTMGQKAAGSNLSMALCQVGTKQAL